VRHDFYLQLFHFFSQSLQLGREIAVLLLQHLYFVLQFSFFLQFPLPALAGSDPVPHFLPLALQPLLKLRISNLVDGDLGVDVQLLSGRQVQLVDLGGVRDEGVQLGLGQIVLRELFGHVGGLAGDVLWLVELGVAVVGCGNREVRPALGALRDLRFRVRILSSVGHSRSSGASDGGWDVEGFGFEVVLIVNVPESGDESSRDMVRIVLESGPLYCGLVMVRGVRGRESCAVAVVQAVERHLLKLGRVDGDFLEVRR